MIAHQLAGAGLQMGGASAPLDPAPVSPSGGGVHSRSFIVPGVPVAKARARTTHTGHTYTPKRTVTHEQICRVAYQATHGIQPAFTGPVEMHVNFFLPIPTSWSKAKQQKARDGYLRPTSRPDLDNLAKLIADALNGCAYIDDSQIVSDGHDKWYSDNPATVVMVRELP